MEKETSMLDTFSRCEFLEYLNSYSSGVCPPEKSEKPVSGRGLSPGRSKHIGVTMGMGFQSFPCPVWSEQMKGGCGGKEGLRGGENIRRQCGSLFSVAIAQILK